jgi:hypothetical protein
MTGSVSDKALQGDIFPNQLSNSQRCAARIVGQAPGSPVFFSPLSM